MNLVHKPKRHTDAHREKMFKRRFEQCRRKGFASDSDAAAWGVVWRKVRAKNGVGRPPKAI